MLDYKNKNPYEILGVQKTDSAPVIEREMRNKMYLYCSMNSEATDINGYKLQDLYKEAARILTTPEERKKLDIELSIQEHISNIDIKKETKNSTEDITNIFGLISNDGTFSFIKIINAEPPKAIDIKTANEIISQVNIDTIYQQQDNKTYIIIDAKHVIPKRLINQENNINKTTLLIIEVFVQEYINNNQHIIEELFPKPIQYTKK